MARRDLLTALRNAVERGESLEDAKNSLINANYNKQDVEEAAKEIEAFVKKNLPRPPSLQR